MFSPSLFHQDLEHVLAHTRGLWEGLRGGRLFITGGTGFFGMWLVESFLWANERLALDAQAVVLSRDPRAFCRKMPHLAAQPALTFHQGDVCAFDFPPGRFSHVIHAATVTSAELEENPLSMFDVWFSGTRRTLEFARHCGACRFLFPSSGAVYGRQPPELSHMGEDYPAAPDTMDPGTVLGQAKRLAEHLCVLYAKQYGLEVKVARCFAFVGPYLSRESHFAVSSFLGDGMRGGPIRIRGDGTPYRSYLYAADLAVWLWTILIRGAAGRAYNVGSEEALTIAELAAAVAAALEPHPAVQIARQSTPDRPAERYVPSTRRAAAELDLRQHFGLAESIARTVEWTCLQKQRGPKPPDCGKQP
jgi:nucleoside-diphosphate-sugar epimerase